MGQFKKFKPDVEDTDLGYDLATEGKTRETATGGGRGIDQLTSDITGSPMDENEEVIPTLIDRHLRQLAKEKRPH